MRIFNIIALILHYYYTIMRIIKLEVERYGERGIKLFKYAVSLDPKRHQKIANFIAYIQKICKLEPLQYGLEIDGFQISKHDRTKALKENVVYKLRISHSSKKDYQIRSSQVGDSDEEAAPETNAKGVDKKSKLQQKIAKIARKKKKESSSDSASSSSSSDQEASSSSSSSSESSEQVLPKHIQYKLKGKRLVPSKSEHIIPKQPIKPSKSQTPKNNKNIDLPTKMAQRKPAAPESSSSSSSSSESQEQLPTLVQNKNTTSAAVKSAIKPNLPIKAQQAQPEKKQPSNLFINPHKKAVINDDSSSESEPSQYHPKKKPQVTEQPQQKKDISKPQSTSATMTTNAKPKNDIKLPPALRNKAAPKKNFDQHKENQWICIDKQKLKKWQEFGNKNICQANNKIRFKIVELDEQKFIPVKSGWITGQVKEIRDNKTVCLVKVQQEGKPYREAYEIPEHNMDELQINRLLATKQQIQCFEQKKEQEPPKQPEKAVQQQNKQAQKQDPQNDKNSVEKFVCGQANYYFSDKNYNTDLFMQMHANRNPQKYINISFLLNFPKIKKVLHNVEKLYEYLKQDEKYEQRNYEIDFERRLIRKKNLVKKPEQGLQSSNKNKQKVLKEGQQPQGGQIKHQ